MRKKRLVAFSLMIGLWAPFITPQIDSAITASAQDAKPRQDGFIIGCSETVIDALDECIQKRFSKADDGMFGMARVPTGAEHVRSFLPATLEESEVVSELERGGWQVGFYLAGRQVLGLKPEHKLPYGGGYPGFGGPILISPQMRQDRPIEQIGLPDLGDLWERAQKAMLSFDSKDQYDFSFGKWSMAARPIRAGESCLRCHNNVKYGHGDAVPRSHAPSPTPVKVGDALGAAIYAYARKQTGGSTLR
jgi:hypothetical protein